MMNVEINPPPEFMDTFEDFDTQAGFPFDTEEDSRLPRSSRLQKHLDELANRHPEFAEHLRPDMSGGFRTWGPRHRRGSGGSGGTGVFSSEDDASDCRSQASGGSEASGGAPEPPPPPPQDPEDDRARNKLPQYGLRNTMDLGGAAQKLEQSERNQRSWSAPPDARTNEPAQPKRFVSRIEIQPKIPGVQQTQASSPPVYSSSPGKPPMAPKPQPAPSTNKPATSNVRHIPIFVEGRDEPVLPKDTTIKDEDFTDHHFKEFNDKPNFSDRFPRSQFSNPFHQQHFGQSPQQHFTPHPQTTHGFNPHPQTTHGFNPQPAPPQKRPTASQTPPTKRPTDPPAAPSPPPPPPAPPVNDPLAKVAAVQKDVDALTEQVAQFTGTTRDKQYMYLDEMLTRNLIQLDDIETQGKENIRQARKDTIRSIQRAISMLESKAPIVASKTEETMDVAGGESQVEETEAKSDDKVTAVDEQNNASAVGEEVKPSGNAESDNAATAPDSTQQQSSEAEQKETS